MKENENMIKIRELMYLVFVDFWVYLKLVFSDNALGHQSFRSFLAHQRYLRRVKRGIEEDFRKSPFPAPVKSLSDQMEWANDYIKRYATDSVFRKEVQDRHAANYQRALSNEIASSTKIPE